MAEDLNIPTNQIALADFSATEGRYSNTMQMIMALQKAGKSFDVQVGPDMGHSALSMPRMMEFFIENLVLAPADSSETRRAAD